MSMRIGPDNMAFSPIKINSNLIGNSPKFRHGSDTEDKNRTDKVALSPTGKAMNLVENLIKQKKRVQEQRSELMATTAEKGRPLGSIEDQLKSYDEQLKNLDQQIATATVEQNKPDDAEKMKNNTYKKPEPKTKEEVQAEKMSNILVASASVEHAEIISSVKASTDGEIGVLKSEIKTDGGNVSQMKIDQLTELETKSGDLITDIAVKLNEATAESDDIVEVKPTESVNYTEYDDKIKIDKSLEELNEIEDDTNSNVVEMARQ